MTPSENHHRAVWDATKDQFLVAQLQAQADMGKRANTGFKKEAWSAVTVASNKQFKCSLLSGKIKPRLDALKKDFKDFTYSKNNSGFGWDDLTQVPTAPDEVWAAVIETNKNFGKFRTTPFPLHDSLTVLLSGAVATGEHTSMLPGFFPSHTVLVGESEDRLRLLRLTRCRHLHQLIFHPQRSPHPSQEGSLTGRIFTKLETTSQESSCMKVDRRSAGMMIGQEYVDLEESRRKAELVLSQQVNRPVTPEDRLSSALVHMMEALKAMRASRCLRLR